MDQSGVRVSRICDSTNFHHNIKPSVLLDEFLGLFLFRGFRFDVRSDLLQINMDIDQLECALCLQQVPQFLLVSVKGVREVGKLVFVYAAFDVSFFKDE